MTDSTAVRAPTCKRRVQLCNAAGPDRVLDGRQTMEAAMLRQANHRPHTPSFARAEKLEGIVDILTLAVIVGLGGAMLIGLLTAPGSRSWGRVGGASRSSARRR